MPHTVIVGLYKNTPYVDPDPCCICRDCDVEWVAAEGVKTFDVDFTPGGGPFSQNHFDQGHANSGKPAKNPGAGKKDRFKYTVVVNGHYRLDPSVDVDGGP